MDTSIRSLIEADIEISLEHCKFYKDSGKLMLHTDTVLAHGYKQAFPRDVWISSPHTGRTIRFSVVGPEDVLFDQDQWDGEQQVYRPLSTLPSNKVNFLVIHRYPME
jgi:hypothetical protein